MNLQAPGQRGKHTEFTRASAFSEPPHCTHRVWGQKRGGSLPARTPGRKVKKLYFWLLMTFRGYLWSLFSGCPNQTVRGLGSPPPQHLSHSQHLWERHAHTIKATPTSTTLWTFLVKPLPGSGPQPLLGASSFREAGKQSQGC